MNEYLSWVWIIHYNKIENSIYKKESNVLDLKLNHQGFLHFPRWSRNWPNLHRSFKLWSGTLTILPSRSLISSGFVDCMSSISPILDNGLFINSLSKELKTALEDWAAVKVQTNKTKLSILHQCTFKAIL